MSEQLTQGQRIKEMRLDHRFTQEYVAAQLGTTKQAIYKYEADLIKTIPTDKLLHLAQLFSCSPAWLQGLTDERGSAPSGSYLPLVDAPCGVPHQAKNDYDPAVNDVFNLYRDLMDVLVFLTPAERRSVLQFAQFLVAQRNAVEEE